MDFFEIISFIIAALAFVGGFLLSLWWIWVPWFLFIMARDLWLKWRRSLYIDKMDWILLEVTPSRDIKKTAQAMEQFFTSLHTAVGGKNWWEANIQGQVQRWFSMEIASIGGETHFFIRTVSGFRNMIESYIYGQYSEVEIKEVPDYVNLFPDNIPNEDYNLWGTEFILEKEDAYPIRTYFEFEKEASSDEQRIDPLATLMEIMGKMTPREQIWIQTLVRPVKSKWKEKAEELRDVLVGRKKEKKEGIIKQEVTGWKDASKNVTHQILTGTDLEGGSESNGDKKDSPFLWTTTKGEQDIVAAIEKNISKLGFETIIRFLYIAPRDIYQRPYANAVTGAYKQFNSQHLNGFKANGKISTDIIDYWFQFRKIRQDYRPRRVLADYKKRAFLQQSENISYLKPFLFERLPIFNWFSNRSKLFVLNVEELATIFHFPIETVKAPLMPKVESRKGEPPTGLPTE